MGFTHNAIRTPVSAQNGADLLGLGDEVGSVDVGKGADLVLLEANPLDDPRAFRSVVQVMREGELRTPDAWMSDP